MPIPKPKPTETQIEFVKRCTKEVKDKYSLSQQFAVCSATWNRTKSNFVETYNDYPEQATENAKIALRWVEKNGWGSCGTAVGKQRANQLANKENISRETIARMAGFERHRQSSKKPLGDGCGRLMWLCWGGDAGIKWAQRKLKQIDANS